MRFAIVTETYPLMDAMLEALLASYRDWGGTAAPPRMVITDFRGVPTWSEFEILAERWHLHVGARRNAVAFGSADRYVTADNPDDNGRLDYAETTPVAGISPPGRGR